MGFICPCCGGGWERGHFCVEMASAFAGGQGGARETHAGAGANPDLTSESSRAQPPDPVLPAMTLDEVVRYALDHQAPRPWRP